MMTSPHWSSWPACGSSPAESSTAGRVRRVAPRISAAPRNDVPAAPHPRPGLWGCQPGGDDGWVDVLCRLVVARCRRAGAGVEHVVVVVVDADGHVRSPGEAGLASCEVLGGGDLVVTAAVQDRGRVVAAQVQPVRGNAEGQLAARGRGGQLGAVAVGDPQWTPPEERDPLWSTSLRTESA
jgi:hypothetical protein